MKKIYLSFFILSLFTTIETLKAQPVLGYQVAVSGFTDPVDVVNAGDSRLFIIQQNGQIFSLTGNVRDSFMNINSVLTNPLAGEQGLLSIAFHPQYATNGYFFLWYTGAGGNITLARYRRSATNPAKGDPASGVVLLSKPKPGTSGYDNHNGGKLNFGADGYLYISTGDGGSGGDPFNNAQRGDSYLGKMLRIDVNNFTLPAPYYSIPSDNPYIAANDGFENEIFATGLRNPFRWSFDRLTGDMWIADVGQGAYEEVNYVPAATMAARNYGWKCREGLHPYGSGCNPPVNVTFTDPIFEYTHNNTTGGFSITGGYVYRGSEYPSLNGYYVTADYVSGNVWIMQPNGSGGATSFLQSLKLTNVAAFGEGIDGTLYALRRSNGTLYKVNVSGVLPLYIVDLSGVHSREYNDITWRATSSPTATKFQVEESTDNINFTPVGTVQLNTTGSYSFRHFIASSTKTFYRVAMVEADGALRYSSIIKLDAAAGDIRIYPTVISNGAIQLDLPVAATKMSVFSNDGRLVFEKNLQSVRGTTSVNLPFTARGVYIVQVTGETFVKRERILVQ